MCPAALLVVIVRLISRMSAWCQITSASSCVAKAWRAVTLPLVKTIDPGAEA